MRKLIYGINLTLDGCCDHTKMIADEEVHGHFAQRLRDADTLVYGRKTYQMMVPFWPDMAKDRSGQTQAANDFAQAFDAMRQLVVFSKTLEKVEGKNARIAHGSLQDEILKLKQEPGKPILVGGVALPSQLTELGLIDEYQIVVHPVIAGRGRRLFDVVGLPERLRLKLVELKVFRSGCVALRYTK